MRKLGDKAAAKALAAEAGIPTVPGYNGAKQDQKALLKEAQRIGFPLLIKAIAGGGGRGLRVVDERGDVRRRLGQCGARGDIRVRRWARVA